MTTTLLRGLSSTSDALKPEARSSSSRYYSNWYIAWCEAVTSRAGHEGQEVESPTKGSVPHAACAPRQTKLASLTWLPNTLLWRNPLVCNLNLLLQKFRI